MSQQNNYALPVKAIFIYKRWFSNRRKFLLMVVKLHRHELDRYIQLPILLDLCRFHIHNAELKPFCVIMLFDVPVILPSGLGPLSPTMYRISVLSPLGRLRT